MVSFRLVRFMASRGVHPNTQFAQRKGLSVLVMPFGVSHTLHIALESGQEDRIIQINFNATSDRANHKEILFKLCSVGIGVSVMSEPTQ